MESRGVGHDFGTTVCTTSTRLSHRYTCVPSLPPQSSRSSQNSGLCSVCHKTSSRWLSISHLETCVPMPAQPLPPPLCPQLHSLCVSPWFPCTQAHQHRLSRFRIYGDTHFLTGRPQLGVSGPFMFMRGRCSLPHRLASAVRWFGSHPQS